MNQARLESMSWTAKNLMTEMAAHTCDLQIQAAEADDPKNDNRLSQEMLEAYYHMRIGESKLSSILKTIKEEMMRELTE